ncbi:MAG TPA: peptidoglycan editing factor PgeF [Pseudolabrys sp.]|nr:peptidoglycan editing factor PgeF [Pseudolabrys sp.]
MTEFPLPPLQIAAPSLQATLLSKQSGIRHAFFMRIGGVSEGVYESLNGGVGSNDDQARVSENRARMATALRVKPENLLTAYQVHSPDVIVATEPWTRETRPRVDAIVTQVPGLAVGVSTADCGPVLLADAQARVVGAAHAGWRGAFTGVLEATLAAMEKLGARRERIAVGIGPMIRLANYEVGAEFVDRFHQQDPENLRFFRAGRREGHALFDLAGYITARLKQAGVASIGDLGNCTYAEPELFYSYRRSTHRSEPDYGRHINAIALSD